MRVINVVVMVREIGGVQGEMQEASVKKTKKYVTILCEDGGRMFDDC